MENDADSQVIGAIPAGEHLLRVRAAKHADPAAPVVVVLPAMGVPARYYRPFVAELNQLGMHVVTFDFRGQGECAPRASRRVRYSYQTLLDDIGSVLQLVDSEFPGAPKYLLGHSLGGQLAVLYSAVHPEEVQGVALVAAGSAWYRSFSGLPRLRTRIGPPLIAAISRVLGYWPGHRFGFGGRQASGLMRDWARQSRTGRYLLAGSDLDYEAAVAKLKLPLLTVAVDEDDLAPESAIDHLAGKAPEAPRTHHFYSRAVAGAAKLGHFAWVHNSGKLAAWVKDWIESGR